MTRSGRGDLRPGLWAPRGRWRARTGPLALGRGLHTTPPPQHPRASAGTGDAGRPGLPSRRPPHPPTEIHIFARDRGRRRPLLLLPIDAPAATAGPETNTCRDTRATTCTCTRVTVVATGSASVVARR